ncbi:MAG: helix-turn-helix domain-containing protein [Bacillota bacterium]|jgi:transcriptional regulator with XRE-family HTH domain
MVNADEKYIRDRITQLRLKKNVSEYRMSYDLGHSRGYIYNISCGRSLPSMIEFLAICDYFEITPKEFFDAEQENPALTRETAAAFQTLTQNDAELVLQLIKRLTEK